MYPRVLIDLGKFKSNVEAIKERLNGMGIGVFGVSKVFCCDRKVAQIFEDAQIEGIADSRIDNLKKVSHFSIKKVLLRLPMHSEIEDVVKYSDISLNSEISTIELLSQEAIKQNKVHGIILMFDLGDLREGFFEEQKLLEATEKIVKMQGVKIVGIGTNLTCFGAIIPKMNHMEKLVELKHTLESKFDISIDYISAGNSSSYYLTEKFELPKEINNLRLGELFVVGSETAYSKHVEGMEEDVFVLEAQIIELKEKPSLPIGESGVDAFGRKPVYEDKGKMMRAICAVGKQDADIDGIVPFNEKVEIIGSSSDHIILDVTKSEQKYKVGDTVKFHLKYGGILSVMTGEYVKKVYINE